jgi:predicted ester cyclase
MRFNATGKKIVWSAVEIFRLSDGKVSDLWTDMDSAGMMMQLGMELKLKEEEK